MSKSQQLLVRISASEAGLLKFISQQTGMSMAEVLRTGLKLISCNKKPSEIPKLKKFYAELDEDGDNNESEEKQSSGSIV